MINLQQAGLYIGLILFFAVLIAPAPGGMDPVAWKTTAVALLMATWWITETIPIAATSFLPIVLFPVLGIATITESTTPYANPLIFLFLGGFIIAIAMQTWDLHKRIALHIILFVGVKPSSIIAGFIIASAFLSMWVSNTATALMMLPIAISVLQLADRNGNEAGSIKNFEIVLVLAIAYACNIGGIATLIGTPPNALFAAFMHENYGVEVSFVKWMAVGVPLILVLLPLMYYILTRLVLPVRLKELPGGKAFIEEQISKIGRITKPEIRVAVVFGITACLWIFRPLFTGFLPGLSDAGIAITAGVFMFILPSGTKPGHKILKWSDMKALPWGILILFGGGLSLAMAINSSGLAVYIGNAVKGLSGLHLIWLLLLVVLIIVFLTEITSNTATTSAFLPILASMAIVLGQNPMLFTLPAAMAASCAFMLPVATPPNAIIYGSGKVTIPQMAKAGLWLNIFISIILTFAGYYLFTYVFGIIPGVIPDWIN
jgi:solute carrier family 13 (sodium-dependent dicarboxylate transporter), member 2/3/5